MGTHSNDPHQRDIAREKAQRQRELDAQIAARKQAWQQAELSRDPKLTMQASVDRQIAEQNAHRLDPHREKPRAELAWRGTPWWHDRWLWPLRLVLSAIVGYVVYGVISNIIARDGMAAVGFVMILPIPVYVLLMTWANKKV